MEAGYIIPLGVILEATMKSMNNKSPFVAALFLLLSLSACASSGNNQTIGTAIGAVAGYVIGEEIGEKYGNEQAGRIIGAAGGAVVGSTIGRYMDDFDQMREQQALERSRTGHASTWVNPDSGHRFSYTPVRTFQNGSRNCREFQAEIFINGQREYERGTACRQHDGSWVRS